jgi:hypothetical protein
LLNSEGKGGIDGMYFSNIDICSDDKLFNLQSYKTEFSKQYGTNYNNSLLLTELIKIRKKAIEVRNYYNENLTNKSKIVHEYLEKAQSLKVHESIDFIHSHHAVVLILNYCIYYIFLGTDRIHLNESKSYSCNYMSNNYELANICQYIIDFIDEFEIENKQTTNNNSKNENKAAYLAIFYATIWNQEGIDFRDNYKNSTEFYKWVTKEKELKITPNNEFNKTFQKHYLKLMPKIPGKHLMNEQANKNKDLLKTRISTIKATLKNCDFTNYPKTKKYLKEIIEFT